MLTLKDKFKLKKMQESLSKIGRVDNAKRTKLMLEAMDASEYEKITNSITKLREIGKAAKENNLKILTKAMTLAVQDIQKFQTKDDSKSKTEKIKKLLGIEKPQENPLIKSLALVGFLENGFSFLPKILQNNIANIGKKKNTSLANLGSEGETIKNTIKKAFKPSENFGKMFPNVPYIEMEQFIDDFFNKDVKIVNLLNVSQKMQEGQKVSDISPKAADPKENSSSESGQSPVQQKANIQAVQNAAKNAGISEEETIKRFLEKMEIEDGIKDPKAPIAIKVLKDFAVANKVADDQLDGFVDGLFIDQAAVKQKIAVGIKKAAEAAAAKEKKKFSKA